MFVRLKPYISVFFLLAFLFPSVVKEIHIPHHEEKVRCEAGADKHFHELHHDCTLCDFVIPVVSFPAISEMNFSSLQFSDYLFPIVIAEFISSAHFSSAQLRAPPVC